MKAFYRTFCTIISSQIYFCKNKSGKSKRMSTEGETITIQVPNNFPSDSLVSVVGSDGLTYAVRLPKDAVPGSKINVLIPTRVSVDSTDRSTAQNNYTPSQITIGAAAAAGIAGTLILGPVVGVLAAGGAVYATTREDEVGAASRAVGSAAISAFNYTSALCTKHKVYDKLKSAGEATVAKLAEVNEEYKLADRARHIGASAVESVIALDSKYEVSRSISNQASSISGPRVVRAERIT